MTRAIRLSAALLLAGLGLVSLPSEVPAENNPWRFNEDVHPEINKPGASVHSLQQTGGFIGFGCFRDEPISEFAALVSVAPENEYPLGSYPVLVTIDNDVKIRSTWQANPRSREYGLLLGGQEAYNLAQAVARAKRRVTLRTPRGIIFNDLSGAAQAIDRLLKYCRLQ